MIESILVATDGSEAALTAERFAITQASKLRVRLAGVSILEDRDLRPPYSEGLSLPPFPEAELAAYHRARAEAVARRFVDQARAGGLEAVGEVAQGVADERIIEKGQSADLIVIGTRGLTGLKHVALGSVANRVARTAPCPVLTIGNSK